MLEIALYDLLATAAICAALAGLAYWRDLLTLAGSAGAFAMGLVIGVFGGVEWVLVLLVFLVSSFAATRYGFEAKRAMGQQEGRRGERGLVNVAANGFVACLAAAAYPWVGEPAAVLFLVAVASAASDTLASELGVLSPNAYLITNGRRVAPGTNGGVSLGGTAWALVAAAYVSLVGAAFLGWAGAMAWTPLNVALPVLAGFLGCNVDSVLGATLETRGYLTKLTNNLASIALATALAAVVMFLA
ncbi:MAG: DUF92 domain-containing protein [Methanobacteriota archaeon]